MAQKKNDAVQAPEDKMMPNEEQKNYGSFVATFWDQYELSRERVLKSRENREDAYLNAVRELIKFNKQYRKSLATLYEQTKKTNKEMVTELMHQITPEKVEMKEEGKMEAASSHEREELKKQLKDVTGQVERLALTPVKSVFQIIDQLEDNFERNAESSISFARERRNAWQKVRKEYVKMARNTHLNLVERGKDSIKVLLSAR